MKKINFYFGALAVASTALLSSCFSSNGDVETPEPPTVNVVEQATVCTILPSANVSDVTFAVNGTATKGNTITVTATAQTAGKYTQDSYTKTITIGDETSMQVAFEFTLKAVAVDVEDAVATAESVTVYQGKSENGEAATSTTNESEAATEVVEVEGATANQVAMEVPKEAVADAKTQTGSTSFSVVVVPANDDVAQVPVSEVKEDENKTVETSTLSAICEPSGARFDSKPVTITINAPESAGLDFYAKNGNETIDGTATASALSVAVPHFSAWDFILKAVIRNVKETETATTKTVNVKAGANTVNYTSTYGWSVNKKNVLVNSYLVGKYGPSKEVSHQKSVSFNSTGNGLVTYNVYDKTVEFDVVSGTATFHVVAKAGSRVDIVKVEYTPDHSGGSAN